MKRFLVLVVLVCPAAAYAEPTYTNADLARFQVPGAYTNEDLKRLPPPVAQKAPIAPIPSIAPAAPSFNEYQAAYDALARTRRLLAAELDLELDRIEASESAFAGASDRIAPRLGYRARARNLVLEVEKRIALVDTQIEATRQAARRAGVAVDRGGETW